MKKIRPQLHKTSSASNLKGFEFNFRQDLYPGPRDKENNKNLRNEELRLSQNIKIQDQNASLLTIEKDIKGNNAMHQSCQSQDIKLAKSRGYEQMGFDLKEEERPITFGVLKNNKPNRLVTSREYLKDKQLKDEVLEEIMKKQSGHRRGISGQRPLVHSVAPRFTCENHPYRKAEYRLIAQISSDEEEMYYCTRCTIKLLQHKFKLEEINDEGTLQNNYTTNQRGTCAYGQANGRIVQLRNIKNKLQALLDQIDLIMDRSSLQSLEKKRADEIQENGNFYNEIMQKIQTLWKLDEEKIRQKYQELADQAQTKKEGFSKNKKAILRLISAAQQKQKNIAQVNPRQAAQIMAYFNENYGSLGQIACESAKRTRETKGARQARLIEELFGVKITIQDSLLCRQSNQTEGNDQVWPYNFGKFCGIESMSQSLQVPTFGTTNESR